MQTFLYSPVTVLEGSQFAFTVELEVPISTYDNFLCVVFQNTNRAEEQTVISKLCKVATEGYDVGITAVDEYTLLVTIPQADLTDVEFAFYDIEMAMIGTDNEKFEAAKLFEVKPSKIS